MNDIILDRAGEILQLQQAARIWLAHYDQVGAREFNRRFGTREVHGDDFVKFLREFLAEGDRPNSKNDLYTA